jgi:hypothetical protein
MYVIRILLWIVVIGVVAGAVDAEPARRAQPRRARPGLSVPEVSRDEVICFALYTVHKNILKLTAQLYPLKKGEDRKVRLEIRNGRKWKQIADKQVIERGWTATFRVEKWDSTKDVEYRVAHGKEAFYTGTIKKDPVDKDVITMFAFTGNSINPSHGGDIPKTDIVRGTRCTIITGITRRG